jgi:hypothetical protein
MKLDFRLEFWGQPPTLADYGGFMRAFFIALLAITFASPALAEGKGPSDHEIFQAMAETFARAETAIIIDNRCSVLKPDERSMVTISRDRYGAEIAALPLNKPGGQVVEDLKRLATQRAGKIDCAGASANLEPTVEAIRQLEFARVQDAKVQKDIKNWQHYLYARAINKRCNFMVGGTVNRVHSRADEYKKILFARYAGQTESQEALGSSEKSLLDLAAKAPCDDKDKAYVNKVVSTVAAGKEPAEE